VSSTPRLELADEIAKIFVDMGIDAEVYRGRDATDPQASPRTKMCREGDRVKAIESALAPIDQKACKSKGHECQFYQTCGYQRQQKLKPKVWIITHPLLFYERPDFIPRPLQISMDEAFWSQSLKGLDKPYSITLKELRQHRPIYTGSGANKQLDAGATADLRELSDRIANAIEADGMGRIHLAALTDAGITAKDAIAAFRLEWRRKKDLDVFPNMEIEKVDERSKLISDHNQQVAPLAKFFELLARTTETECIRSPWLEMKLNDDNERAIFMTWRMDIHHSWSPLGSVAILNAATRPAIIRPFFPRVAVPTMHSVTMPYTHVTQIVDRAMTEKYGLRNVDDIRRHIEIRAAETAGRVLVVCQEQLEAALRRAFSDSAFPMPTNVEIAHFNNLSGLNSWQDVELLIAIGRTEPSPRTVEGIARAYFGREVIEAQPDAHGRVWYPRGRVGIRMRDCRTTAVIGNEHPDWRVETIRWLICEAELMQAIGRGRGVRRTAANPLRIEILCNIPLAIEVDEVVTWDDDLKPSRVRVMLARGVVPMSYRDMAAVHDDLFVSQRAAETAIQREAARLTEGRRGTQPLNSREYLLKACVDLQLIPYRRAGRGQPPTELLYIPTLIPDPEAWLTERLGPVVILGEPKPVEPVTPTESE
jgi:putative DNA primase/helicase